MSIYAFVKNETLFIGKADRGIIKTLNAGQTQSCSLQNDNLVVILKNGCQLLYEVKENDIILKRSFAI